MSIEQHGQNVQKVPVEQLPPYPHTKEDTVVPAPEHRDDKHDKKFNWKKPAAVVALLGAGAMGALGIGKAMGGGDSNSVPERSPSTSAPATPGQSESSTPEQNQATAVEFGFSAETYANNPEKLMTDFADQINTWENSGFTEGVEDKAAHRFDFSDDMDYAAEITAASNDAFANSVLADGWQTNEHLTQFYKDAVFIHSDNIATALKTTHDVNRDNKEHYVRTIEVMPGSINAEVTENGDIKGTFDYQGHDNSDMNRAEDVYGGGVDPNSETGTYSVTFHNFGGKLMLTDIEIQAQANQN